MKKSLEPDHGQIRIYLTCMLKHADPIGFFSLRAFFDDKQAPFYISAVAVADGLDKIIDGAIGVAIKSANAERPVVFCPPLATFTNGAHAREQDLLQGLALSAECDAHPNEAREKLEKLLGPATIVVRSGGVWTNGSGVGEDKLHLHWRLARPAATGEERAKLKQARRLAAQLAGADHSNIPLVHGTRCPGSWHRKKEPRLCKIVSIDTKREIELDAALATLNAAAPAPASASTGGKKKKTSSKKTSKRRGKRDYEDLIKNGSVRPERSEDFQAVVWHLARKGMSIDDITAELGKYPQGIGAKYAGRLRDEVVRSYGKWKGTHIEVVGGELPRVVDQAEAALLASGHELYQRGLLVRPAIVPLKASDNCDTQGWRLLQITEPYLVDVMTRAASFVRFDARSNAWVSIDAPLKVAKTYLARAGEWKLPVLTGVSNTPFLRPDGSLCQKPGYDAATGLLLKLDGQRFSRIPERPSKADALAALALLREPLRDFPFVTRADEAVALSAMLTGLDRSALQTAPPLHGFDAPVAGSGKSKLVDIVAVLMTGYEAPAIGQGRTEEELEKRLDASLLAGDRIINIDNCSRPLESSKLCLMLTQPRVQVRILGKSKQPEVPSNTFVCCTGNGLVLVGDLTRRTLRCSLDPKVERPELREFEFEPVVMARERRGELVVAALTILRAWLASNERMKLPPYGSFETWSRRVREALVWLGCADPCDTVESVRADDPQRSDLAAILAQWEQHLGFFHRYTAADVIECATFKGSARSVGGKIVLESARADFKHALLSVAGSGGERINHQKLGIWLASNENKIVDGMWLCPKGKRDGSKTWALRPSRKSGG